jgi:hypothetical protein
VEVLDFLLEVLEGLLEGLLAVPVVEVLVV